jgi:hypothetical protein
VLRKFRTFYFYISWLRPDRSPRESDGVLPLSPRTFWVAWVLVRPVRSSQCQLSGFRLKVGRSKAEG